MQGVAIESAKAALLEAISNLTPTDSFNIIAFNERSTLFSPSMELATNVAVENAAEWIDQLWQYKLYWSCSLWLDKYLFHI